MNISYENHLGSTLNLNDGNYFVNANDLRDFAWEFEILGRPSGYGGRIKRFSRHSSEKTLNIAVRGTKAQFIERMNALHALTEPDVLDNQPGKLWLDGQYVICYMGVSSEINLYSRRGNYLQKEISIIAIEPFWCKDVTQRFISGSGAAASGGKKYDGRYDYRYGSGYNNQTLYNSHYAPCPIILTIYGAVANPSILIDGHEYAVNVTIDAGERLEIDQIKRTIYRISGTGVKTSVFDYRDKSSDIFQAVRPGALQVQFSGTMTFDITMVQQRSEPLWI